MGGTHSQICNVTKVCNDVIRVSGCQQPMATPNINENCHYVQNDPHKCKIKLEKFHFDILCRFGVIKESLPGVECPPPRCDRVNRYSTTARRILSDIWHEAERRVPHHFYSSSWSGISVYYNYTPNSQS